MTLTLLKIYNDVAIQPWSAFDSEASNLSDMESSLISAINKALIDIWYSYPFSFRIKKFNIKTVPKVSKYNLPNGNIQQEGFSYDNVFSIKIDNSYLDFVSDSSEFSKSSGKPTEFTIEDDNILFNPSPDSYYNIAIKYVSMPIGFDEKGNEIYSLENLTDYIDIPEKYEVIFKNALVSKAMTYAITSVSDENYAGYKLQFDSAYKLLTKVSSPLSKPKSIIL